MLTTLGWNDALETAFAPHAADGHVPARVSVQRDGDRTRLAATVRWE